MEYELTDERRRYIEAKGFSILTACPGSGKTTSIAYKLGVLNDCKSNRVISLSFTNNAVAELIDTYECLYGSRIAFPHVISTIDSFLSQYIVLPFWYLIPGLKQRPTIMDDTKDASLYERPYKGKDGKLHSGFYTRLTDEQRKFYYSHKDKEYSIIRPESYCYGNLIIEAPEGNVVARHIINRRLNLGILTSADVEYYSKYILSQHPVIAHALAKRFNYLIMDEAQDMSKIQFEIIQLLINGGLQNVELVGDLRQSIYAWRNAYPEMFRKFLNDNKWDQLQFIHNRRSTQTIIDQYNKIKEKQDPEIRSHKVQSLGLPIYVYHFDEGNEQKLIQHYINVCESHNLHQRKIICRGTDQYKELSGNEDAKSCWKSSIPTLIIKSYDEFSRGDISESIKTMKYVYSIINDKYKKNSTSNSGKNEFVSTLSSLEENPLDISKLLLFLRKLPSSTLSVEKWQSDVQSLIEQHFNFGVGTIDFEIKQRMDHCKMKDVKQTAVCDFFNIKFNPYASEVSTVHKVKGLTFDACLVFLKQNQATNLSLELFSNAKKLKERHRLLYVACSRPRQLLALAIPKSEPKEKIDKYINPGYLYIEI